MRDGQRTNEEDRQRTRTGSGGEEGQLGEGGSNVEFEFLELRFAVTQTRGHMECGSVGR